MLSHIKDAPYTPTAFAHPTPHALAAELTPCAAEGRGDDERLALLHRLLPLLLVDADVPDNARLQQIDNALPQAQNAQETSLPGMARALEAIRDANQAAERGEEDTGASQGSLAARYQATAANLDKVGNIIRDGKLRAKAASNDFSAAVAEAFPDQRAGAERSLPIGTEGRVERQSSAAALADISTGTSYAELWGRIATAISGINKDYVEFYADLMQKYTKMFEAYNNTVQKAASDAVKNSNDANKVMLDTNSLNRSYLLFSEQVNKMDLGMVKNWGALSDEQHEKIRSSLKPAFKVGTDGKIEFDLNQFETLKSSELTVGYYPTGPTSVTTIRYQAWLSTFNGVGSALQSNMQSFSQAYGQSNNTFSNLTKVLSGVISSMGDSAKDVLKSLS